jgi:NADH-quinone oxidoreductase subunit F
MDLKFTQVPPTAGERSALDKALGAETRPGVSFGDVWLREGGGIHQAASRRHLLLGGLHALAERVGYISEGGLGELARRLDVPPSEAYGVASFYALFPLEAVPLRTVHVCTDLACSMLSALPNDGNDGNDPDRSVDPEGFLSAQNILERAQALAAGRTDVRAIASPCLGLCERAPAVLVAQAGDRPHEAVLAPALMTQVSLAIDVGPHDVAPEPAPSFSAPQTPNAALSLLGRIGAVDPLSLNDYQAHGGYEALTKAIAMGPEQVIAAITESNLVGRGGAAFPAGRKWAAVAGQPVATRFLVCNADESEPGTFKDRVVMEGDPFAIVEAMTIAALACGIEKGYIYLRGEYPRALHNMRNAIAKAHQAGLLGTNVSGAGFTFDIEIVKGAGAYICGEETAIFNSIEGYRGEPRSKPPFPVEVGLFGKPTLVNNVETLANVLPILRGGATAYLARGTAGSAGTKLFCVSGAVNTPGIYEVNFGATLRELIDLAGGLRRGHDLQAVLLGGAAGSFVTPHQLDMPLTFEGARADGATLGSGVVLVIDTATPIAPMLQSIAGFFRSESCGQCVPCRVGTVRQQETLGRLANGTAQPGDAGLLREIGQVMKDASICGLGQTAWNAIESALDRLDLGAGTGAGFQS